MSGAAWIFFGAVVLIAGVFLVPRLLISRAQDLLAKRTMAREGKSLKLLTRAELAVGRFRRIPGLLLWRDDVLAFQGIAGHTVNIPPSRIQKIVTADRLASGRLLIKLEVLRLTHADGEELEFVVARDSADAWRRLLGEWSVREHQAGAAPQEVVTPGRKS
ncbi:MAG TPA: hypothetical protein VGK86_10430 [Thermoanaerobaculia bacterium]